MPWLVGVDACRVGWVAAFRDTSSGALRVRVEPTFAAILAAPEHPDVVAVDIPVGLPEAAEPGGRACDRAARALLGRARAASVFSAPVRAVLSVSSYAAANATQRATSTHHLGLSLQTWNIVPRIAEVDAHIRRVGQDRAFEVHPELCFMELGGGAALAAPKRSRDGQRARLALLSSAGLDARGFLAARPRGAGADDVLDALVALWTAERFLRGRARRIPDVPVRDVCDLRMEIWR